MYVNYCIFENQVTFRRTCDFFFFVVNLFIKQKLSEMYVPIKLCN